jgi:hypothetical protein
LLKQGADDLLRAADDTVLVDETSIIAGVRMLLDGRLAFRTTGDPGGDGSDVGLLETPFHLLEAAGFEVWLVNTRDVL